MSMSIDSMASMLNTTNTDATTNYNANALKKIIKRRIFRHICG